MTDMVDNQSDRELTRQQAIKMARTAWERFLMEADEALQVRQYEDNSTKVACALRNADLARALEGYATRLYHEECGAAPSWGRI